MRSWGLVWFRFRFFFSFLARALPEFLLYVSRSSISGWTQSPTIPPFMWLGWIGAFRWLTKSLIIISNNWHREVKHQQCSKRYAWHRTHVILLDARQNCMKELLSSSCSQWDSGGSLKLSRLSEVIQLVNDRGRAWIQIWWTPGSMFWATMWHYMWLRFFSAHSHRPTPRAFDSYSFNRLFQSNLYT